MSDNYGTVNRQQLDFGPDAPGAEVSTITPFITALGVAGIAYQGPKGRYTVLPGTGRDARKSVVYEAATVRRIGAYSTREAAIDVAMRRAGIDI